MESPKRRLFLKKFFFYTSAGAFVHVLAKSFLFAAPAQKSTGADGACHGPTAKSINYVEDLAKALKQKTMTKTDRPGTAGKVWKATQQTCDTCMLYNYKKETPPQPTCQLIPGCLVKPKGSCNSWIAIT